MTGQDRLVYDSNWPYNKSIPYYNTFLSTDEVVVPKAYIIPQGWHKVIDLLKGNNIDFTQFDKDTTLLVEVYSIDKFTPSKTVYEGHYPNKNVSTTSTEESVQLRKGDYIFKTNQLGTRYIVETLEPTAPDSFFAWNFFDTILQQKEGFSPYVFEDLAKQLIDAEPELRKAFNKKKKEEPDFALNWYAQLDYIYKNSPYYEEAHLRYPVYRLVK